MGPIEFAKQLLASGTPTKKAVLRKRRILTLQSISDSIMSSYQESRGLQFGAATTINTSGLFLQSYQASLKTAAGNGTWRYVAATHMLYWTAPGDTEGVGVNVAVDGLYDIPSGTATLVHKVGITNRFVPGVDRTDTVASATRYWRLAAGSIMGIVDAFTNRRFTLLPHLGIGGNYASEINARFSQAIATSANGIIVELGGTNDICANDQTAATVITRRTSSWDMASAAGIPLIALAIMPRFGAFRVGGSAGADAAYTAAHQANIVGANRGLYAATKAAGREGVYFADCYSNMTDPTAANGYVRNYETDDGLHPQGGLAIESAIPVVRILNQISPDTRSLCNIGAGAYYDATNNPGGNLIGSNLGTFAGTGGTLGTGAAATATYATSTAYAKDDFVINSGNLYRAISAGTSGTVTPPVHSVGSVLDGTTLTWLFVASGVTAGIATGWTTQRFGGSNIVVKAHKLAATDGGPDWQEFIISGATLDESASNGESITFFPTAISGASLSKFTVDTVFDTSIQCQIIDGAGCYGAYFENIYAGGLTVTHDNRSLNNTYRGIRWTDVFTLGLLPIPYATGTTNIQPKFYVQSKMGAVFRARFRSFDIHNVV